MNSRRHHLPQLMTTMNGRTAIKAPMGNTKKRRDCDEKFALITKRTKELLRSKKPTMNRSSTSTCATQEQNA